MKKIRVAINGFGRIGRLTTRNLLKNNEIELVAINDLSSAATLAQLFRYDSLQGKFNGEVSHNDESLTINGQTIQILKSKNVADLPWKALNVDVVAECTGIMRVKEDAEQHLTAGARKVVISAPAKGGVKTIVLGINDEILTSEDTLVSNASCTTNCAAPMVQILESVCGIEHGFLSTVHAYTSDQRLHDSPHSDLRRARAAGVNIIPTTTGAAETVVKIFPHLKGKLTGAALRVPVPSGSLTELTVMVKKACSVHEINAAFQSAASGRLKGILEYSEDPLVSSDIVGNPHSAIFDAGMTELIGNLVRIYAWYDNEAGYSARMAEIVHRIGSY